MACCKTEDLEKSVLMTAASTSWLDAVSCSSISWDCRSSTCNWGMARTGPNSVAEGREAKAAEPVCGAGLQLS